MPSPSDSFLSRGASEDPEAVSGDRSPETTVAPDPPAAQPAQQPEARQQPPAGGTELKVYHDGINEQVVIGAALVDRATRARLLAAIPPDTFLFPDHAAAWTGFRELERRGLDYDPATMAKLCPEVSVALLETIAAARPDAPPNLDAHVAWLFSDRRRATAIDGPLAALLEKIRDPRVELPALEAVARQLAESLGGGGHRRFLRDGARLAEDQAAQIKRRRGATFPFGIDGLDYFENAESARLYGRYKPEAYAPGTRFRRMVPGAFPGGMTVITAVSGGGKTTFTANLIVALARAKRRVLCAAWEPGTGIELELLASIVSGVRRADLMNGQASDDDVDRHAEAMRKIARVVKFMDNPWLEEGSRNKWTANADNMDLFSGYLSDSGCDVVVADVWNRMLDREDPSEEAKALWRQQAVFQKLGIHGILLHQMRFKDVELRADKRPTREGMKGSGAYVEVPDAVLGIHYPAMWKAVDPNRQEVVVLKQRYGVWPLGVEVDFDPATGRVSGGRSIPYDQPTAVENDGGGASGVRVNHPPPRRRREGF